MERKKTESRIQQECCAWFRNNYCLKHHDPQCIFFSVPNEGQDVVEQMKKKAIGMMSGVSDTVIVLDGSVVFCEFKDESGRQSENQKKFQGKVERLGHQYWVVRSLDDFKDRVLEVI